MINYLLAIVLSLHVIQAQLFSNSQQFDQNIVSDKQSAYQPLNLLTNSQPNHFNNNPIFSTNKQNNTATKTNDLQNNHKNTPIQIPVSLHNFDKKLPLSFSQHFVDHQIAPTKIINSIKEYKPTQTINQFADNKQYFDQTDRGSQLINSKKIKHEFNKFPVSTNSEPLTDIKKKETVSEMIDGSEKQLFSKMISVMSSFFKYFSKNTSSMQANSSLINDLSLSNNSVEQKQQIILLNSTASDGLFPQIKPLQNFEMSDSLTQVTSNSTPKQKKKIYFILFMLGFGFFSICLIRQSRKIYGHSQRNFEIIRMRLPSQQIQQI